MVSPSYLHTVHVDHSLINLEQMQFLNPIVADHDVDAHRWTNSSIDRSIVRFNVRSIDRSFTVLTSRSFALSRIVPQRYWLSPAPPWLHCFCFHISVMKFPHCILFDNIVTLPTLLFSASPLLAHVYLLLRSLLALQLTLHHLVYRSSLYGVSWKAKPHWNNQSNKMKKNLIPIHDTLSD